MKFILSILALGIYLASGSICAAESKFADSFRVKLLSTELAQEIVQKTSNNIKGLVAISRDGLEPAFNLATALKIRVIEILNLNDSSDEISAHELLEISSRKLELPSDGEGWIFISPASVTGNIHDFVKKRFPKATFAAIFKTPNGKADFYAEGISQDMKISYYWKVPGFDSNVPYKPGVIMHEEIKNHCEIIKQKLASDGVIIKDMKGLIVTRSGLAVAGILGDLLGIKEYETIGIKSYEDNHEKKAPELIKKAKIDGDGTGYFAFEDMIDSGDTAEFLHKLYPKIIILSIHIKPKGKKLLSDKAIRVYYSQETDEWVTYYWEAESVAEKK